MSIWHNDPALDELRDFEQGSMPAYLGIYFTELGPDFLCGTMPVDHRTRQPFGLLHGGASVALAETLSSTAAALSIDRSRYIALGQEINANHLRSVRSGTVTGTARPVHIGTRSQVWAIEIVDESSRLVCISRATLAIAEKYLRDKRKRRCTGEDLG